MNEQKAIEQLKRGNIKGLEALVRAYQVQALRAAYLITQDRDLAEDVVQTAFLRSAERINQFDANRPFGPWFLRIVVNDAIKAASRSTRFVSLEGEAGEEKIVLADLLVDPNPGPGDRVEALEVQQAIRAALSHLPPEQRGAIVQRYYLGWSEADMAEHWSCPTGTIKWRLHAARKRLRALLHTAPLESDYRK
jgi:RNA polymerase sigma-70 factor (ECF subfamily)